MSSYKLALGHIGDEARVFSCLLIDCLLLLRYDYLVFTSNLCYNLSIQNSLYQRQPRNGT